MTSDMIETIGRAWSEAESSMSYGVELIRLVDGVHTYRFHVGSETQEFDNIDDGYAWQRERKCVAKGGAFLAAIDAAGFVIAPKEPTPDMIAAGWIDKEDVNPDDIYCAMIDAALKEPKPS